MEASLKLEVDKNYDFFQRNLSRYLKKHAGEYALLKSAGVIAFYEAAGDAYREGLNRFPDGVFSIQKVSDTPVELGLMSVAVA